MITADVTNESIEKLLIDKVLEDIISGKRTIKEFVQEVNQSK